MPRLANWHFRHFMLSLGRAIISLASLPSNRHSFSFSIGPEAIPHTAHRPRICADQTRFSMASSWHDRYIDPELKI